VLFWFRDFN